MVAGHSVFYLSRQIDGIDRTPRMETLRWLHDFDHEVAMPSRIVTGFQTIPLDTPALATLAGRRESTSKRDPRFFTRWILGFQMPVLTR